MRSLCAALLCGAAALLVAACAPTTPADPAPSGGREPRLVERTHDTMGTELRLTAWTRDEPAALTAFDAVFAEFDRLEALMTVWDASSEVSRLNAAAGDRPVPASPEVREVLTVARQVSEWTDGAFDVTFGALADLWKFDYQNRDGSIPSRAAVQARLSFIDYRDVVVDDAAGSVFIRRKGVTVNVGGIGKGYAVDRGVAILRRRGLSDFMIQAGGDLYVAGRRGDRPWRLGIQDPRGPANRSFATIDLSDATFSTSGDYERFFIRDGRRYHHILDLRAGEPARGCRSVTLVTSRAILADALAKGVFVLGPTAGMALIERLPDVDGVIVGSRNEVLVSSGLQTRLTHVAPPTDAL